MKNRTLVVVGFIVWLLFGVSCGGKLDENINVTEGETKNELGYVEMPLGIDEIVHISGTSSIESKPILLEGPGQLGVYWQQNCDTFILKLVNTNENLAEAPSGTLIYDNAIGPSEYTSDSPSAVPHKYVPGEYQLVIDVEGEDCRWETWAKVTYPNE